jgi:hypothetical protein
MAGVTEARKFELDLLDGKSPLVLWYCNGGLIRLCQKIDFMPPMSQIHTILEKISIDNLPVFVWAGRWWDDRDAKVETIRERIEASPLPFSEIYKVVVDGLCCGLNGKTVGEMNAERES